MERFAERHNLFEACLPFFQDQKFFNNRFYLFVFYVSIITK
jgi:hypothetical protein